MPDKQFKEMASRFMAIWQRQVETLMKDPNIILESMNTMQKMQENMLVAKDFAEGLAKNAASENNPWQAHFNNLYGKKPQENGDKKTSTSSLYQHRDDDISGLARRLADVEQRLERIEQLLTLIGQGSKKSKPRAKARTIKRNKKTGSK